MFKSNLNELDVAVTLCVIFRTASGLNGSIVGSQKPPASYNPLVDACAHAPLYTLIPHGERGGGINAYRILPSALFVATPGAPPSWNIRAWAEVFSSLPINFNTVMGLMDQPEFHIPDQASLELMMEFWSLLPASSTQASNNSHPHATGAPARFPCEAFLGIWNNRRGQLSVLKRLITAPHTRADFSIIPGVAPLRPIEDLIWMPTAQSKAPAGSVKLGSSTAVAPYQQQHQHTFHPWYCPALVQSLLSLVDIEHELGYESRLSPVPVPGVSPNSPSSLLRHDPISPLFARAVSQCPELFACMLSHLKLQLREPRDEELDDSDGVRLAEALARADSLLTAGGYLSLVELLDVLVTGFVSPNTLQSNTRPVLSRLWMEHPRLVASHLLKLYNSDRAMLARVLDVVQELKDGLQYFIEIRVAPFCIDLVVLASKRQFLKLEIWLVHRLNSQQSLHFFLQCLEYLKLNTASHENPIVGANQPRPKPAAHGRKSLYNPLSIELAATMYRILSAVDLTKVCQAEPKAVPTELSAQLAQIFNAACQVHPALRSHTTSRTPEFDRELARREASSLCEHLISKSVHTPHDEAMLNQTVINMSKAIDPRQRAVYLEFVTCLIEEAQFVAGFPESHRQTMVKLYSVIIKEDLAPPHFIGRMLAVILDALNEPEILYSFAMSIMQCVRDRLTLWPAYCYRVSQIETVISRNKQLVLALQNVYKDAGTRDPEFNRYPTERGLPTELLEGLRDGPGGPRRDPAAVAAAATPAPLPAPAEAAAAPISDNMVTRVRGIINNVTKSTMPISIQHVKQLPSEVYPHFASQMVMRVTLEAINCPVYAELVQSTENADLETIVLDAAYKLTLQLFHDDKQGNQRVALGNLGTFIGALTLAKDKPVPSIKLDIREEFYRAYDTHRIGRMVSFMSKLLIKAKDSVIFRLPNPWMAAMLTLLRDCNNIKEIQSTVIQFDIQSTFETLNIQRERLGAPDESLTNPDKRPRRGHYTISFTNFSQSTTAAVAAIHQAVGTCERRITSVLYPKCKLFQSYPNLRKLTDLCLEFTLADLIQSVRENFNKTARRAGAELGMMDVGVMEGREDEDPRFNIMAANCVRSFLVTLNPETVCTCMLGHASRLLNATMSVDAALVEEFAHMACSSNITTLIGACELILTDMARHAISDQARLTRMNTPQQSTMTSLQQQAMDKFYQSIQQLHQAILQVPNYKTMSVSPLLQQQEHPVFVVMSQTIPNSIKAAMNVHGFARETVFRAATHHIVARLLDPDCRGSILHTEIYKTLLWNIGRGFNELPRELTSRLLLLAHVQDPDRFATVAEYVHLLLKDELLLPRDVDDFILASFNYLLTHQLFITQPQNGGAPQANERLLLWIQLIESTVLPPSKDDPIPVVALAHMPRTADALRQAVQAVSIPTAMPTPKPYSVLSASLSERFERIIEEGSRYPQGHCVIQQQHVNAVDRGAVGDAILPTAQVVPMGAYSPANIISAEADSESKSGMTQTYEHLMRTVETRNRNLAGPELAGPCTDLVENPQLAHEVLSEWVAVFRLDDSHPAQQEQAYVAFDTLLWRSAIWHSRVSVRSFLHVIVNIAVAAMSAAGRNIPAMPPYLQQLSSAQIAGALTALIVYMTSHTNLPLRPLSEPGRGDALYTGAGLHVSHRDGDAANFAEHPKPASVEQRIRLLRDYALAVADCARALHATAYQAASHAHAHSHTSASAFPAASIATLLHSLLNTLNTPATLAPVGSLVPSKPITKVALLDLSDIDVLLVFHDVLRLLSPVRLPGFVLGFVECISHRAFMPRFLAIQTRFPLLSRYYTHLLLDLLAFLSSHVRGAASAPLADGIRHAYKATLRIFLALFRDYPEVLAESAIVLCDRRILPDTCLQLRNIILAAHPRQMAPLPSLQSTRVDSVPEMSVSPRLVLDPRAHLSSPYAKQHVIEPLDRYCQLIASSPNTAPPAFPPAVLEALMLPQWVRRALRVPEEQAAAKVQAMATQSGCGMDSQVMLAVLMYLGYNAMAAMAALTRHQQSQGNYVSGFQTLAMGSSNPCATAMSQFLDAVDADSQHLMLVLIVNQLRYPNSHTHFFSVFVQHLYLTHLQRQDSSLCEHIVRVIFERLVVHSPYPWGLLVTFVALVRNPVFEFWKQPFTRCDPRIEELFKTITKSCLGSSALPM